MDNFIVLYNPLTGNGTAQDKMRELESLMQGDRLYFSNMLDIRDYGAFFNDMPDGASIIICGGDGTLNRFLNDTRTSDQTATSIIIQAAAAMTSPATSARSAVPLRCLSTAT